ncbi:hypothetical protein ABFS82_03G106100 [Erythranthe guttata]|uniref:Uncharacterized protein n=1 Tax=Erythranthe guttata TaxID=4155 RepID=A0A022Q8L9_ERYGU|nr:PREDICTED: uncharacterized protein LOC105974209 [Erythranthe guttata]EYU22890.1 hypothetical protein MIMGU_mgv1a023304mg [Erythranthe guttata]|eukprot:XP_012854728.1 PREDICTED: uncharacterized protein LOC105974209 [Erythranthe guttata]
MSTNTFQHLTDQNNIYYDISHNQENYELYDQEDEEDYEDAQNSNYIYIVNTILNGTARLNILLPTATILSFTIFAPLLTNYGKCTALDRWQMGIFLALLATSCVLFSLTDSFKTGTGRLYYGVATLNGIRTFGGGRRVGPCVPSDYKLRWRDLFHSSLSLIALLTFALFHNDVLSCYRLVLPRKFINTVPLAIGFVISVLFVLFPSTRSGIGYPFLLQSDALHIRN